MHLDYIRIEFLSLKKFKKKIPFWSLYIYFVRVNFILHFYSSGPHYFKILTHLKDAVANKK